MVDKNAVQAHLDILQGIIERMASSSSACKNWCITVVSAILILVADKGKSEYVWIALVPTVLFGVLDAYYLGLEKIFRRAYNEFIDKVHANQITAPDLYVISPPVSAWETVLQAFLSFSVWMFYLSLLGMIWATKSLVL